MRKMVLTGKSWLLCAFLLLSVIGSTQVTEQWVKRQNGHPNSPDVANDLAVDHTGNVYVTGGSHGKGTNADFATIKYDNFSNTKWVKRYNGPGNGNDQATAIAVDDDGNVYVTGWSTGSGTGFDFTTIKYDAGSNTKWVKRYNGPGNGSDEAMAIAVDDDGNVYVTGRSTGSSSSFDYTTIKYDDDGDTEWVKRYNGPGNASDQPTAIAVDDDGNVYVTGASTGSGTGFDYATIKYDDDGNQEWVQRYNGPVNAVDRANDLAIDDNGNVYVSGLISTVLDDLGANESDIATIKYNATGVQQWTTIFNLKGHDEANALAVDASGNVYITGVTGFADEDSDNDYITVKYNAGGVQQWAQTFGAPRLGEGGEANDLVLDASGNVYITGGISLESDELEYATIKYNTNGVQQWVALYNGPGNAVDNANAIGLDHNGNVFVTGGSMISENDYATIKYIPNGTQKWVKRYNGPGNQGSPDVANALAVDEDGNVHVTGGITRNITGMDYTTYKYDDDGDREWKKTYSGPGLGPDQASDIALDAAGNVYITGQSFGTGTSSDFATIKYDDDGNTKWVRRYNGPGNGFDKANAITVDGNGNVYVTGGSTGSGTVSDYTTIKYNNNGDIIWVKRYNGPGNFVDIANVIAVDAQGNVYVTGTSSANGASGDYTTIKYDANGNELWVARYDGPGKFTDEALALAVDASGNVYVTGGSYDFFVEAATIKYNAAGVEQWVVRYNSPANSFDQGKDIAVDASGNVYITGVSQGGATSFDYTTIKYNAAGAQQWEARYNGPGNGSDAANALALDGNGDVYVTGSSSGSGTFNDYATVKYNAAGVEQWVARYDGPGHSTDVANDIAVDDDGNVYVTGQSIGNGTGFDYATIKYEQTLLITSAAARQVVIPNELTDASRPALKKLQAWAYPNSFSQFINLQWSGGNKPVTITVTDVLGRLVEKRTNLATSGSIRMGYHWQPGMYYATIMQGREKAVMKLIKGTRQ